MSKIDWDDVGYETRVPPDFTPANVVEIRTISDALKLLDEWQAAYQDLRRDLAKLNEKYIDAKFWAETNECSARNYELLYRAALKPENDDIRERLAADLAKA